MGPAPTWHQPLSRPLPPGGSGSTARRTRLVLGPPPDLARPWLHPSVGPAAGSLSPGGLCGCRDLRLPQRRALRCRGAPERRGLLWAPWGLPPRALPQQADPRCLAGLGRGPGREAAGVGPGGCGGDPLTPQSLLPARWPPEKPVMQEPDILRLKANVSGTQAELRRPPGPRGPGAAAEEGTPTHKPRPLGYNSR